MSGISSQKKKKKSYVWYNFNILLFECKLWQSTVRLYFLQTSVMFANFQDYQRSITMSLINV